MAWGHGDMNGAAVGPDKAVLEANHDEGFRLAEKAVANLGLKWAPAKGEGGSWTVPRSALVQFQDHTALYRLRDGWFLRLDVSAVTKGAEATVKTAGLRAGDSVVTEGVGLLRATDLDVEGGEDDDHDEHEESPHDHDPDNGPGADSDHHHSSDKHKR